MDYRRAVTIHGDDVLAHTNWEIGEKFLRQYGSVYYQYTGLFWHLVQSRFLIDKSTLNISNRWRRERGESELRLSDIGGSEQTSPGDSRM